MQNTSFKSIVLVIAGAVSLLVVFLSIMGLRASQENRGQAAGSACSEGVVNTQFRISTTKETPWFSGTELKAKVNDVIDINCFTQEGRSLLKDPNITILLDGTETILIPNRRTAEVRKLKLLKPGKYTVTCSNTAQTCRDADTLTVTGEVAVVDPNVVTPPTSCKRGGCSGNLCVDSRSPDMVTTCAYKDEYACYQTAECKIQPDGLCGFTPTAQLQSCLANPAKLPSPTPIVGSPSPSIFPSSFPGQYATSDLNRDGKVTIEDYFVFLKDYRQQTGQ